MIPAAQRRKADAADMVNELRRQGVEVHRADARLSKPATWMWPPGDYIVRADQPYRTLADMYFSVQNYPTANPQPLRRHRLDHAVHARREARRRCTTKSILDQPMTLLTADAKAAGGVEGTGSTLVVEHTSDNNLMAFRFRNQRRQACWPPRRISSSTATSSAPARSSFPTPTAPASSRMLKDLGLSAWAVAAGAVGEDARSDRCRASATCTPGRARRMKAGCAPRSIITSIPYTYFADQKLRDGNLRAKYDVIIFPHVGGTAQSMLAGIPKTAASPFLTRRPPLRPTWAASIESDDIRGGMGMEGLQELAKFVEEGGTLITEGSTASMMAEYDLGGGVTVEHPAEPVRARLHSARRIRRPQEPHRLRLRRQGSAGLLQPGPGVQRRRAGGFGGGFGFGGGGGRGAAPTGPINGGAGQNVTPMAVPIHVSPLDPADAPAQERPAGGRGGRGGRGGAGGRGAAGASEDRPRVVIQFPANANDMLLSGTLAGGEALTNRAAAVDVPLGKGHIVLFALRPFWRWQTQGTYFLGFNAILNWDHLDAGKAAAPPPARGRGTAGQ